MVGSTIKHQHSKKLTRWIEATWTKKHTKNANCLQEFVHKKCSKCPPFAGTHTWRRFLHWSAAVSVLNNDLSEIGPYHKSAIKHSLSLLRTVNEQKANVGILHGVNLYIYFQDIWQTFYFLFIHCFAVKHGRPIDQCQMTDDKKSYLKHVLLLFAAVKEFCKSTKNWQSYSHG